MYRQIICLLLLLFSLTSFSATSPRQTRSITLKLAAVLNQGGPHLKYGIKWQIRSELVQKTSTESEPVFRLTPGKYRILISYANMKINRPITVTNKARQKQVIAIGPGRVRVTASLMQDAPPLKRKLKWSVQQIDASDNASKNLIEETATSPVFQLSPGRYRIRAHIGDVFQEKDIDVAAGQTMERTFALNAGSIDIDAKFDLTSRKIVKHLRWQLFRADKQTPILQSEDSTLRLVLPIGEYRINVEYGNVSKEIPVSIVAGASIQKSIAIDAGKLILQGVETAEGPLISQPIRWSIQGAHMTANDKPYVRQGNKAVFLLKAGEYLLKAGYGSSETSLKVHLNVSVRGTTSFNARY